MVGWISEECRGDSGLFIPWPGAKQNDEMVERHNLQQQSALADSVAHSVWEYC